MNAILHIDVSKRGGIFVAVHFFRYVKVEKGRRLLQTEEEEEEETRNTKRRGRRSPLVVARVVVVVVVLKRRARAHQNSYRFRSRSTKRRISRRAMMMSRLF